MVQTQTKRVGTVEEYVLAMESSWEEQCKMLTECELAGGQVFWAVDMVCRRFAQYVWSYNHSEETKANVVKAFAKVHGIINIKLSASEAKCLFGSEQQIAAFKGILGDAKYTILVDSL